jgi:hypothetical protein
MSNSVSEHDLSELRRKVTSFIGRRVRVWTRFNQPVEGILVYFHLKQPFILFLMGDDGIPRMINFKEVVEITAKESFRIPS